MKSRKPKKKVPYKMIGVHPDLYAELLKIREKHSRVVEFKLSWSDFFRRLVAMEKRNEQPPGSV